MWVEETIQAMKVHLLSSNHDSAQENIWEVPFDPSLREVTVSLSGPSPQIELRDPLGIHRSSSSPMNSAECVVKHRIAKIVFSTRFRPCRRC